MENDMMVGNKTIHCKFFEQFIDKEWNKLRSSEEGLEIARWRVLYWWSVWEKEINNCYNCRGRLLAIKAGFRRAGIKFGFEPEVYFK